MFNLTVLISFKVMYHSMGPPSKMFALPPKNLGNKLKPYYTECPVSRVKTLITDPVLQIFLKQFPINA